MIDLVELVFESRCNDQRLRTGFGVRPQVAVLAGCALGGNDENELIALRFADVEEVTVVRFLVDQPVFARGRADDMVLDPLWALVVVALDVVEGLRVGGPDDRAVGRRDRLGVLLAGVDRANANVVVLRSELVDTVSDESMIRTMVDCGDSKELFAFALEVAVIENRLGAALAGSAYVDRVLAALAESNGIGELPVDFGHRAVVLLDTAAHFLEELLAKRFEVASGVFVIGILGVEMRANVRIERARVTQDLLPVRVTQPGIVVDALDAVLFDFDRALFGLRWSGRESGERLIGLLGHVSSARGRVVRLRRAGGDAEHCHEQRKVPCELHGYASRVRPW